jgi:hypothetical protein
MFEKLVVVQVANRHLSFIEPGSLISFSQQPAAKPVLGQLNAVNSFMPISVLQSVFCSLFNDAISSSDDVTSNDSILTIISWIIIGRICSGLILRIISTLFWTDSEKS